MLYQTDLLKSKSSLISVTDNITKADKAYMSGYPGKFFKNIQAVIGNMSLLTKRKIGFSTFGITISGSATITVSAGTPFSSAVAGDIVTISSSHKDSGNHIIKTKVSPTKIILCDALTQSKTGVTLTIRGGKYNLTDAVNDLETRLYRATNLVVTGTPLAPQLVTYAALTDIDRGVAFPTNIDNPLIIIQPTVDRWCYVVRGFTTTTNFRVAATAAGSELGNVFCDVFVTSYPN